MFLSSCTLFFVSGTSAKAFGTALPSFGTAGRVRQSICYQSFPQYSSNFGRIFWAHINPLQTNGTICNPDCKLLLFVFYRIAAGPGVVAAIARSPRAAPLRPHARAAPIAPSQRVHIAASEARHDNFVPSLRTQPGARRWRGKWGSWLIRRAVVVRGPAQRGVGGTPTWDQCTERGGMHVIYDREGSMHRAVAHVTEWRREAGLGGPWQSLVGVVESHIFGSQESYSHFDKRPHQPL